MSAGSEPHLESARQEYWFSSSTSTSTGTGTTGILTILDNTGDGCVAKCKVALHPVVLTLLNSEVCSFKPHCTVCRSTGHKRKAVQKKCDVEPVLVLVL
jgi:hypothetical protein